MIWHAGQAFPHPCFCHFTLYDFYNWHSLYFVFGKYSNLKKWWYILCIILALSTNQNRHSIRWCHYLSGEFTELRLPRVVWDDQQCGEGVSRDAGPRVDWHHYKCTAPAVSGHLGVGQWLLLEQFSSVFSLSVEKLFLCNFKQENCICLKDHLWTYL